ncbi:Hexosyltransferase [Rhynchospora pubera]|uniref:Hexosyltransferase n=1 Tax=Rhynchospora pubera TaxID=906938 RepID=A0AAV8GYM8_9POAL|nr:Hexosyltransferase [Rhynchospora pubera]
MLASQLRGSGSGHRQVGPGLGSRVTALMLAMFASMASFYVAGRLWQDAQTRVYLINELDRRTGQAHTSISVDDTLKVVACRHQHKRLAALQMELAHANHQGYLGQYSSHTNATRNGKRFLAVIGIMTGFGRKNYRDAVRKSWLPSGATLKKLEQEKGILVRFVIGRSANKGDNYDRAIDDENRKTNDFLILENHVEGSEERPMKTKRFFGHASDTFDAEFYARINDDIYINVDALGGMLSAHWDKPRVYIGCMKSGEVFSESSHKWYEPDWWKFGDGKTYFRHASGEMVVISRALAQFISINRLLLRTYAHDDVSIGSWMIGLDVKHVNEGKLCCSSWSPGAVCSAL